MVLLFAIQGNVINYVITGYYEYKNSKHMIAIAEEVT